MITEKFQKQLVLLGGGHANIQVLKKLCMNKYHGLHTILINNEYEATYSGLTPSFIQNQINKNEILIDLQRLCFNAGAIFIKDIIISLDTNLKIINLKNHPSISYDILSINTGSISNKSNIQFHKEAIVFFVKPISFLVNQLEKIDELVQIKNSLTVIGSGIAGYEICFALKQRYQDEIEINLVKSSNIKEKNINRFSRKKIAEISKTLGIIERKGVAEKITNNEIILSNGDKFLSDINLISTGASMPEWLKKTSLEKDEKKFLLTNEYLQSSKYKDIFISGDLASVINYIRPKSGVMAVRHGEVLKNNIFRKIQNKNLIKFKPQKNWLYIINTSKNKALLNYFFFSFHSEWCLKLKLFIDRAFMKRFEFPNKRLMKKNIYYLNNSEKIHKMYCQGCGSKVSKNNLVDFLHKENDNLELSDSTQISFQSSSILQTIDHIKLFSSFNPYDFGIISYLHSQNDILAAGGEVISFSVSIGLPYSEKKIEKFYLEYFMKGIQSQSNIDKSIRASGHSYQTNEPGITINMNGEIVHQSKKNQAVEGDLIYLSKPLGTGYLLASYFENSNQLNVEDLKVLKYWLKKGNLQVVNIARKFGSKIMTDISGFGLASHLSDICRASKVSAEINLINTLLINDNLELLNKYKSTGFENNYQSSSLNVEVKGKQILENILYDPQTNGPMLFSISENHKNTFETECESKTNNIPLLLGKFIQSEDKLIICS